MIKTHSHQPGQTEDITNTLDIKEVPFYNLSFGAIIYFFFIDKVS